MNHRPFPPRSYRPVPAAPTSGLAITSMILGILSLGTCLVPLGIFAVIFGHASLLKIKRSGSGLTGRGMAVAGLVTGYIASVIFALITAAMIFGSLEENRLKTELFPLPDLKSLPFDKPPGAKPIPGSDVRFYDIQISNPGPGGATRLRVLLPPGVHADDSLPCVLVAPAGTDLLSGSDLDEGEYFDETLPYAEAGMVVVNYSIDGAESGEEGDSPYDAFRNSGAGVANGAVAYKFASEILTLVDPQRIYSAGHSSAGTLSLLLAAHLPDLAGSLAYAPCCDVAEFHKETVASPLAVLLRDGLSGFVVRSSPLQHAPKTKVPVFLFGSREDELVGADEWEEYAGAVRDGGGTVTLKIVDEGDHYGSMISDGIPAGIEWIKGRP